MELQISIQNRTKWAFENYVLQGILSSLLLLNYFAPAYYNRLSVQALMLKAPWGLRLNEPPRCHVL